MRDDSVHQHLAHSKMLTTDLRGMILHSPRIPLKNLDS